MKNFKNHLKHGTRGNFETSIVGPLRILFALVNSQTGKGSYKSGNSFERTFLSLLFFIHHNLASKTWKSVDRNVWKNGFQDTTYCWNHIIFISVRVDIENLNIKIVQIVLGPIWWHPITTTRVCNASDFPRIQNKE